MYYYGMKLHALGFCNPNKLPHPEEIIFTSASVNDLSLFKEAWSEKENRTFLEIKYTTPQISLQIWRSSLIQKY